MKLWRKPFDGAALATTPGHVYIDTGRCKGCGYCVEFCPRDILKMGSELNPKGYLFPHIDDETSCLACGYCEVICPEFAIRVSTSDKNGKN